MSVSFLNSKQTEVFEGICDALVENIEYLPDELVIDID